MEKYMVVYNTFSTNVWMNKVGIGKETEYYFKNYNYIISVKPKINL